MVSSTFGINSSLLSIVLLTHCLSHFPMPRDNQSLPTLNFFRFSQSNNLSTSGLCLWYWLYVELFACFLHFPFYPTITSPQLPLFFHTDLSLSCCSKNIFCLLSQGHSPSSMLHINLGFPFLKCITCDCLLTCFLSPLFLPPIPVA